MERVGRDSSSEKSLPIPSDDSPGQDYLLGSSERFEIPEETEEDLRAYLRVPVKFG